MKRELKGVYATDTGALIELVYGTPHGRRLLDSVLDETTELVTHELAITELRYILCRRLGREHSDERVRKLIESGYIRVEDVSGLIIAASAYKCNRRISLPDCFTLSLGKEREMPVLFATKEKEIAAEMEKEPFNLDILFLEDAYSNLP